jgi:UDP-N-acetylglucosamine transferase subunit ALG13
MPIIDFFIAQHCEVHIASSGRSLLLLQQTYPQLQCHELPSYNIQYAEKNSAWNLLVQAPKVYKAIHDEHEVLEKMQEVHSYELIISDNRYGIYHKQAKSIIICHQLYILPPKKLRFTAPIFWNLHKQKIYAFDELWIPDDIDFQWSGVMAHGLNISIPHHFIGTLSRFSGKEFITEIPCRILVILSGPEPQRTILERMIIRQAEQLPSYHFTIVRGITEQNNRTLNKNLTIIDHLITKELEVLILESEIIIARPGYSTIMDMAMMEKKTILIPTPGQTEQEYLATYLAEKNMTIVDYQHELRLSTTIPKAIHSKLRFKRGKSNIDEFLNKYFSYTH